MFVFEHFQMTALSGHGFNPADRWQCNSSWNCGSMDGTASWGSFGRSICTFECGVVRTTGEFFTCRVGDSASGTVRRSLKVSLSEQQIASLLLTCGQRGLDTTASSLSFSLSTTLTKCQLFAFCLCSLSTTLTLHRLFLCSGT